MKRPGLCPPASAGTISFAVLLLISTLVTAGSAAELRTWRPVATDTGILIRAAVVHPASTDSCHFHLWTSHTNLDLLPTASEQRGTVILFAAVAPAIAGDTLFVSASLSGSGLITTGDTAFLRLRQPDRPFAKTLGSTVMQAMPQDRLSGVSLNGMIAAHDLPTEFAFEYGADPGLSQVTPWVPLGGELSSVYQEDFDHGFTGLMMPPSQELALSSRSGGGAAGSPSSYPSFLDFNHRSGIGTLFLTLIGYTSDTLRGFGDLGLGGGCADFRDAMLTISSLTHDFDAQGTMLRFWAQSKSSGNIGDRTWVRANWYNETASLLPDSSDVWQTHELTLRNWSSDWVYAGTDLSQQRNNRYAYWPLDSTLGRFDTDFLLTFSPIDTLRRPTGEIYFDDLSIRYRTTNLLAPANGGSLISAPVSIEDPSGLTDGWRGAGTHGWSTNDSGPASFVYRFDSLVTLKNILLAQHPDAPVREVSCSLSVDGVSYQEVWSTTLDSTRNANPFLNFKRVLLADVPARYLKVVLLDGYGADFGLAEIEAYGTGAALNPGLDSCSVSADVRGFAPGATIYYRLMAKNSVGIVRGEIDSCVFPADSAPMALTQGYRTIDQHVAEVRVTSQGRGKDALLQLEYRLPGDSLWRIRAADSVQAHPLQYATEHWYRLDSLPSGSTIEYRAIVSTMNGCDTSRTELCRTPVNHPPALTTAWSPTIGYGQSAILSLQAADPDSARYQDQTHLQLIRVPSWLTLDSARQQLAGMVPFTASCNDSVVVQLTDDKGGSQRICRHLTIQPLAAPGLLSPADGGSITLSMPPHDLLLRWSPGLSAPADSFAFFLRTSGSVIRLPLHDSVQAIDVMRTLRPGDVVTGWIERASSASCLAIPDSIHLHVASTVDMAVTASIPTLSFPDAAIGASLLGTAVISNSLPDEFIVDSIRVSGTDTSAVQWGISAGEVLRGEREHPIPVTFYPKRYGPVDDTLRLYSPGGYVTLTAHGLSPRANPVMGSTAINFGSVSPDSLLTRTIRLQKSGLNQMHILSVGGLSEPFEVNSELAPCTLLDTNSMLIPVLMSSRKPGSYTDTLLIENDGATPLIAVVVTATVTIATDVNDDQSALPEEYALAQNYPNPFNPETTIRFDLPRSAKVQLAIFNLLGQEVITLVNERKPAGSYLVHWGETAASGIYFARLSISDEESGAVREFVRKMVRLQ